MAKLTRRGFLGRVGAALAAVAVAPLIPIPPAPTAAVTIPFKVLPGSLYIKGPKYPVCFGRIATPRFKKDVDELRTWNTDIIL